MRPKHRPKPAASPAIRSSPRYRKAAGAFSLPNICLVSSQTINWIRQVTPTCGSSRRTSQEHMRSAYRTLLALCLCATIFGCSTFLRLDILNATNSEIVVVVGDDEQRVAPGLSYSGRYPANGSTILVRTLGCSRDYTTPNLDQSPWKYLIGRSLKLRAASTGVLIAYPPTPDVELKGNPLRSMRDGTIVLHSMRKSCVAS